MSDFHLTLFFYTLDPELRIVHAFKNCAALKVANKYNYSKEVRVRTEDDAEELDRIVEEGKYKICHACWGREQQLARKDARRARPGFLRQPAGYKAPATRQTTRRHAKPTTRD